MNREVTDAIAFFRRSREHFAAKRDQLTQVVDKLDEMIGVLNGLADDDEVEVEFRLETPAPRRRSVRTMVLTLLDEEDRDWSVGEILAAYERRGTPVHGADPNNALRAALADAKKRGMVISTAVGRYKSARWAQASEHSLNGSAPTANAAEPAEGGAIA
ncbi:MAG: hypothetical protein ACRD12_10175 [Acidimicrobiales bacterium]